MLIFFVFHINFISLSLAAHGTGYAWSTAYLEARVGDFVEFEWSTPEGVDGVAYRVYQVSQPGLTTPMAGGFVSSTESTPNGKSTNLLELKYCTKR